MSLACPMYGTTNWSATAKTVARVSASDNPTVRGRHGHFRRRSTTTRTSSSRRTAARSLDHEIAPTSRTTTSTTITTIAQRLRVRRRQRRRPHGGRKRPKQSTAKTERWQDDYLAHSRETPKSTPLASIVGKVCAGVPTDRGPRTSATIEQSQHERAGVHPADTGSASGPQRLGVDEVVRP